LVNADLPASGVTANTYGSSTAIPVVTVNSKGVITSVTTASFTGGLSYQGSWNASTNTPTLTSSVGTNGYYYIVSVAGSINLNGVTDWQVGDWAIFNGSTWQKIDQTNLVSSVNGQTGVVSIGYADLAGSVPTWNQNTTGTAAGLSATLAIGSGGTGQTTAGAAFNALSPITSTGDLIIGNGTNSATRLAIGSNGYLLTSNGTTATWAAAPAAGVTSFSAGTTGFSPSTGTTGDITLSGTLAVANGGTNLTSYTAGDLLYASGTTALSKLGIGTTNYVLTSSGTAPQYVAQSTLSVGSATTATNVAGGAAGSVVYQSGSSTTAMLALGTTNYVLTAGASAPQYVAQSTLSVGSATTATNLAGGAASQIPYQTGSGATSFIANGTAGQVLTSAGASAPTWGGISGGTF
jgi:hypothetical protein